MTTKFYQDCRSVPTGCPAQIKISISSKGRTVYLPTNISVLPSQWDSRGEKIIGHPQKAQLNTLLSRRKLDVDTALYELQNAGKLHGLTAAEIKDAVAKHLSPDTDNTLFLPRLEEYARRDMAKTTRYTYLHTAEKIRAFCKNADKLHFEDITPKWLDDFNKWMGKFAPSQNARNILLRDIRTIFNDAIDDEVTTYYPFRKYKIKAEPTKSRALTIEQVRALFKHESRYVDMFKLSFFLGGISFCDLCALTRDNIVAGRVEYCRQKTGQFCSVGIQPEAQALIEKYAGTEHLIYIEDTFTDYHTFLGKMDKALKRVGKTYNKNTKKWEGDAICPSVSQYWARYTVATLAAENGTSEETIAALLGHSANTSVTSIYTRANRNKQVDEALRSVLDLMK